MRYIITVRVEEIQDEEKDNYGKVVKESKTTEMVNVRMLASTLEKAKDNAKSAVDLMGE